MDEFSDKPDSRDPSIRRPLLFSLVIGLAGGLVIIVLVTPATMLLGSCPAWLLPTLSRVTMLPPFVFIGFVAGWIIAHWTGRSGAWVKVLIGNPGVYCLAAVLLVSAILRKAVAPGLGTTAVGAVMSQLAALVGLWWHKVPEDPDRAPWGVPPGSKARRSIIEVHWRRTIMPSSLLMLFIVGWLQSQSRFAIGMSFYERTENPQRRRATWTQSHNGRIFVGVQEYDASSWVPLGGGNGRLAIYAYPLRVSDDVMEGFLHREAVLQLSALQIGYNDPETAGLAPYRNAYVAIPWVVLMYFPGVLLVRRLALLLRCYRRLRKGLCLQCGYDLRATEHRCPECGTWIIESRGAWHRGDDARSAPYVIDAARPGSHDPPST